MVIKETFTMFNVIFTRCIVTIRIGSKYGENLDFFYFLAKKNLFKGIATKIEKGQN